MKDAEISNALIGKCIGHKAFHFAKTDDYKSRCHIATIQRLGKETLAPVGRAMNKKAPVIGLQVQQKRAESN